jgi:hypothetical protein
MLQINKIKINITIYLYVAFLRVLFNWEIRSERMLGMGWKELEFITISIEYFVIVFGFSVKDKLKLISISK